jgi:hypothetical protein
MPITFLVPISSHEPHERLARVLILSALRIAPHFGEQIKLPELPVPRKVMIVEYKNAEGRILVTLQDLEMPTTAEAKALINHLIANGHTLAHDH